MTTKIRFFLCALAVSAPAWMASRAADSTPARSTGRVLVLDNERTLEGDIERQGDQYVIRRSVGETTVPASKALRLCADYGEAYTYLRARINQDDPDERFRLAQWCQLNGLREQALTEVNVAVALRPTHAASRRLQQNLQRSTANGSAPPAARAKEEPDLGVPAPAVELSAEALGLYVTKVQPILMNACASCHASGRGGAFKLTRTYEGSGANRKTTQQNLTAVLAQVNLERPQTSPFLTKAISLHADMTQAPLKGRDTRAYHTLEEWVQLTIKHNPQLRDAAPASGAMTRLGGDSRTAVEFASFQATTPPPAESRPLPSTKSGAGLSPATEGPVGPTTSPAGAPVDPFDPMVFNRQLHPEKKADGGKR